MFGIQVLIFFFCASFFFAWILDEPFFAGMGIVIFIVWICLTTGAVTL